jgi:hypothetical protein
LLISEDWLVGFLTRIPLPWGKQFISENVRIALSGLDVFKRWDLHLALQAQSVVIWFLGVWQTGPVGRQVSLSDADLLREYHHTLPDFDQSDVCGSCFAVRSYTVHSEFGATRRWCAWRRTSRCGIPSSTARATSARSTRRIVLFIRAPVTPVNEAYPWCYKGALSIWAPLPHRI